MHHAAVKISPVASNKSRDYHDIIDASVKHSVLSYLVRLQFSVQRKVSEGYVIILSAIPRAPLSIEGREKRERGRGGGRGKRERGKEKDAGRRVGTAGCCIRFAF